MRPRTSGSRVKILVAGSLIICWVLIALLAPFLAPYNPLEMHSGDELAGPSGMFPMGTDEFGRDLLSRLLFGARISLGVSFAAVAVALAVGLAIGLAAGYYGGLGDEIAMRSMDIVFAFPPILLAICIVAFFGPGVKNTILAISIVYVPRFARVLRASVLETRGREFVVAARAVGASDARTLSRHIVPNIRAPLLVQTSLSLSTAILFEAALSFLGLGTQPPIPSWGRMLAEARGYLVLSPWASIFPGVAIMFLVLWFNVLGDSVRDLLDPKL